MKNPRLHRSLRRSGLTVTRLAGLAHVGRTSAVHALNNTPGRGQQTRPRLAPLLTDEQLALVGWDREGKLLNLK